MPTSSTTLATWCGTCTSRFGAMCEISTHGLGVADSRETASTIGMILRVIVMPEEAVGVLSGGKETMNWDCEVG